MALSVTTSGSGTLGHIEPGWSEQEFATPASPAERAGGTGTVSFGAQDVSEGVLVIENNITSTDDTLGSVSGVARQTSWAGNRISVTHDNKLARYNATRNMPPMVAASLPGCLDLAGQMLGDPGFNGATGTYWSLFGHAAGFQPDGSLAEQSQRVVEYQKYNPSTGLFEPVRTTAYQNYVSPGTFTVIGGKAYAGGVAGDSFVLRLVEGTYTSFMSPYTKFRLMGKTMLEGQDFTFTLNGKPSGPVDGDYEQLMTVTLDYSAKTVTLSADYRLAGLISNTSTTFSIAALDLDAELAFRVYYTNAGLLANIPPVLYNIAFGVCNTSDYSTVVEGDIDWDVDEEPLWFDPWEISGKVRALWLRTDLGGTSNLTSWPLGERQDWETARDYSAVGALALGEPAIGYSGSVWDWLQDACTVYRKEVGLSGDVVTCRAIGSSVLDISNYEGTPNITPSTTRTGRSVDVTYTNANSVSGEIVYDAREDDNRILSVGASQVTETALQTGVYLTSVLSPTRTTTFIPGVGTYYVVDSTGLPIVADQWEDYGGDVRVSLDPDKAGVINVTLVGPTEIPSTTPPYSLSVSDGENQYAALSIIGTGVVAGPEVLNLLTGADPTKTPVEVGTSIPNNAFICTREQAFDTGIWAGVDVSGPKISLDITVPSGALSGFGLTAGSVLDWRDNSYRVDSATVGGLKTSISASRFVTVGMFDGAWSGETVGDHDGVWDGHQAIDQRILTYKGTPEAELPAPVFPP